MSDDLTGGNESEGSRNYWFTYAGGLALIFPVGIPIAIVVGLGAWLCRRWPVQYWLAAFAGLVVAPGVWAFTHHVSAFETFDNYELAYMTMFFGWLGRTMHASFEQMQQGATAGPTSYGSEFLLNALGAQVQMLLPGLPPFIDSSKLVAMPASFFTALFSFLGRREAAERKRQNSGVVVGPGARVMMVNDKANVAGPITMADAVTGGSFSNASDAGIVLSADKRNAPGSGDYIVIATQTPRIARAKRRRTPLVPKALAALLVFIVAAALYLGLHGSGAVAAITATTTDAPFQSYWVRNHVLTGLWSGPTTQSGVINFGTTSAEDCVFLVVEPPAGSRLHVMNPYSANYAWVDTSAVGSTDPPAQRPNDRSPDQNCAPYDVR